MFNTKLIQKNNTLIVGLSGGPDSVCLLHALVQLQDTYNLKLIAAHLDHEWRKESDQDVLFCRQLCKKMNVTFISKKASELKNPVKNVGSQEALGRTLRRAFFKETVKLFKADAIALGHHKQDQLETFFIRLIRGTTLSGLCGIKEKNGNYIRPLLNASKEDILDYLKKNNLLFLTDQTNNSNVHLRNKIRNTLLPLFKECDTRAFENSLRTISQLQETELFLEQITQQQFDVLFTHALLDIKRFKTLTAFMQKRIISLWLQKEAPTFTLTQKFIAEILRFLLSPRGGVHQLGSNWNITKKENKAIIQLSQ